MENIISVVVPCYNEEESINKFYDTLISETNKIKVKLELIFIDDGSTDNTLNEIKSLHKKHKEIRYISLSRNFGKEAAMLAGLEHVTGDYITIMDVDLQDPPSLLPQMYELIKTGEYDQICTRRRNRKGEGILRNFFTKRFYKLINRMSDIEMVEGARDYRLITRKALKSVLSIKEYNRYSKGIFSFVGYKTKWLEYDNIKRTTGKTKMSFKKLFKYGLDGILSFTTIPLTLIAILGILICFISIIAIIYIIVKTLMFGDPVGGWPSMVCILLFASGVQLFCIGIIGEYLAKIYLETKKRPIYIVDETEKDKRL